MAQMVKNLPDPGLTSGLARSPWKTEWQLTPEFLPGKSHGQRSLLKYSVWSQKEFDTIE